MTGGGWHVGKGVVEKNMGRKEQGNCGLSCVWEGNVKVLCEEWERDGKKCIAGELGGSKVEMCWNEHLLCMLSIRLCTGIN